MTQTVPQLRMGFRRFDTLPPPTLPEPYRLRRYRPGDEDAWIALLSAGEFGAWDRARLDGMLAGNRGPMPLDGICFATLADRPVATACTYLHQLETGIMPEVGWVVVDPARRGQGLGKAVCLAVLNHIRDLGFGYAFLLTEDFRIPAITMYLRFGFEPEMIDPSHPAWWAAMRRRTINGY
ncbi:MAG: GNAT family N-acetyltransferase [Chloroflexi bacterium]|nr:GNAT family N-acetyltransferase [Chloroflexota bacterium]